MPTAPYTAIRAAVLLVLAVVMTGMAPSPTIPALDASSEISSEISSDAFPAKGGRALVPEMIVGEWYPENRASRIRIFRQADGSYAARTVWLEDPVYPDGTPKRDRLNPDPKLRTRRLVGLVISSGFRYDSGLRFTGGEVYDPDSGNTYSCYVTLIDKNHMEIRAYIGLPFLGKTFVFTRA